ncbi:MAG: ABC transporter ATP-binding protein [Pseudomonadota bacterium]
MAADRPVSDDVLESQLQAEDINVAYDSKEVITGLSLRIPDKQITVIIGPNACGKSTLLRSLARLLKPKHGRILLAGEDIFRKPTRTVAQFLGLMPQMPLAPDGILVSDLVSRGRTPYQNPFQQFSHADEHAVTEALKATSIEPLANIRMEDLSGGQRQRVWIAMALAQETEILLLDEPISFLDLTHQIDILELLKKLNRDSARTIVMVLHDLNLAARYADYMVAMCDGEIRIDGTPAEVLTEDHVKAVFRLNCQVISDPYSGTPMIIPMPAKDSLA